MATAGWLLWAVLAASTARAQVTPSPDSIDRCVQRFPALKEDADFGKKVLPVWLDRKYHRKPAEAEAVWSDLCQKVLGDGSVPNEEILQREARATYIADREEFAKKILDQIRPPSGNLDELQGQDFQKLSQDDIKAFVGLQARTDEKGDFSDENLASDVGKAQGRIRALADAGNANLQAALKAQQGQPGVDEQKAALGAAGDKYKVGDGLAFDSAQQKARGSDPSGVGIGGDPAAGGGGPGRTVGAFASAPPSPRLASNGDSPVSHPDGCSGPPAVLNEPVNVTPTTMTLTGPVLRSSYPFNGTTMDARVWTANYGDGTSLQIVEGTGPVAGLHNYTAAQAADAARYLPHASRAIMNTIEIDPVMNPQDAWWALPAQKNDPNFHSYMTAGAAGVMNIYPFRTATPLPGDQVMRGSMIHECGHTESDTRFGALGSAGWTQWQAAMTADGAPDHSVSQYARTGIQDDFAETYRAYWSTMGTPRFQQYRDYVPNRFRILDTLPH
jgi:hypothetical protein